MQELHLEIPYLDAYLTITPCDYRLKGRLLACPACSPHGGELGTPTLFALIEQVELPVKEQRHKHFRRSINVDFSGVLL